MTLMMLPVALVTTGAAALINLWIAWRASQVRLSEKIMVGDGGNERMVARMRAHANFSEYTPIVLILIALIELARGSLLWLWAAAALYLLGRICHVFGMDGWLRGRVLGIAITMIVTAGLAIYAATIPWLGQADVPTVLDVTRPA